MNTLRLTSFTLALAAAATLSAREVPGATPRSSDENARASACAPSTAYDELDLNNVRARIETGGNMWEDRTGSASAAYEVPKTENNTGPKALFAGALWMGGLSPDNTLKLAAIRFRQVGNDYWPGPLTAYDSITHQGDASIDGTVCTEYDRTWKTMRVDAQKHEAYFNCVGDPNCDPAIEFPGYVIPAYFYEWPAHGDPSKGQDYNLAPYHDYNGDGEYTPDDGDYPGFDLQGVIDCKAKRREDLVPLFGDQNIWWVFNDKGNIHTESGGQPIGMEIRAQAFAFATNDEVNNMTFYNYVLINQGTQTLQQTYFGQWVDVDLGGAFDDYVGCDVERGLGYGYNGLAVDEDYQGSPGYGGPIPPPPAVGVDFFEGPYQDYDGIDNPLTLNCQDARDSLGIPYSGIGIGYGDGVVDNERYGMRAFVYHNNSGGAQGDPGSAAQYYNYLRAIWGDGTPMSYGGSGYSPSGGGVRSNYMFPGTSDPLGWGTDCQPQPLWDEVTAGNAPYDRRFIQSAGPFTLEPGHYNNITVGVVWARAGAGGVQASVELMRKADDKAQSLFDNCFRILNGPDAPDLTIQELDRELILYITNPLGSNNYNEEYVELDYTIPETSTKQVFETDTVVNSMGDSVVVEVPAGNETVENDRYYRFQGYQIYQVKDASVSPDELRNADKARLIAQVDVEDGVGQLVNWVADPQLNMPVPEEMVFGRDTGIVHAFRVLEDKFATADPRLTNFKTYHFMAVAYGYNEYEPYDPDPSKRTGQARPYLPGRKSPTGSIRSYSGIPHKPSVEENGTIVNSVFGDGFEITRIEGQGNGANALRLSRKTANEILASPIHRVSELTYEKGYGPVDIKVIDPLKVPQADFELWLLPDEDPTVGLPLPLSPSTTTPNNTYRRLDGSKWRLVRLGGDGLGVDTINSDRAISFPNEQLITKWGFSISMNQAYYDDIYTKFVGANMKTSGTTWYAGIPDAEGELVTNWIRAGASKDDNLEYPDYASADPEQAYERVLGGTWAPWRLVGDANLQPGAAEVKSTISAAKIRDIPSIQVVFTPDKSKWSRCVVVEQCDDPDFAEGGVKKLHMRAARSVDKNGIPGNMPGANLAEANLVDSMGMGWFPGYAIDMETGERLNVFFGENSFIAGGVGRDMVWNPTDDVATLGGGHWIYVAMNLRRETRQQLAASRMPAYDECSFIRGRIATSMSNVYNGVAWVGSGMLVPGAKMLSPQQGLVPSETVLNITASKPYTVYTQPSATYEPAITDTTRNRGLPLYAFSTTGREVLTNVTEVGKKELDLIGVVPNPYYAYSGYETTRLDNRVKFINLPRQCTISIYSVSGTLVRQYKKDNELTYLDWDLKNSYNVPISSGTYICHIQAPELGERVLKWFGVMRAIDMQNF